MSRTIVVLGGISATSNVAAWWPELVGAQIAAVTAPQSVSADGTLWVAVRTHAWMTELSLLEPELLRKLNARRLRSPIVRIRWVLDRG